LAADRGFAELLGYKIIPTHTQQYFAAFSARAWPFAMAGEVAGFLK
jgi:hypothetical protein